MGVSPYVRAYVQADEQIETLKGVLDSRAEIERAYAYDSMVGAVMDLLKCLPGAALALARPQLLSVARDVKTSQANKKKASDLLITLDYGGPRRHTI